MNIFDKFFELLIGSRLSTVLQACSTVAWSRSPIWEPMFAKEAFVNFLKKTWLIVVLVLRVFSSFDCNISKSN
jgi:hypothetical protein